MNLLSNAILTPSLLTYSIIFWGKTIKGLIPFQIPPSIGMNLLSKDINEGGLISTVVNVSLDTMESNLLSVRLSTEAPEANIIGLTLLDVHVRQQGRNFLCLDISDPAVDRTVCLFAHI